MFSLSYTPSYPINALLLFRTEGAIPMPRRIRAYTQWTADTETAFIMALRWHGHLGRALAEIGRSHTPAYDRRRNYPAFAARWDDALDQWRAARAAERRAAKGLDAADVPAVVAHHDGWTPIRRRAFLRLIGEGETATAACAKLGLSVPGANHLRDRDPAFAAAWDRAKGQSAGVLEQVAIERAIDGVEEAVWHAGKEVGTRRRFPDTLLRQLVADQARKDRDAAAAKARVKAVKRAIRTTAHERTAANPAYAAVTPSSMAQTDASLRTKLDALAVKLRREEREAAAAQVVAFAENWGALGAGRQRGALERQEVLPPLAEEDEGPVARCAKAEAS